MRAIWNLLLSPDWWFTTIIMGVVVGVVAAYVYDLLCRKRPTVELTSSGILNVHSAPLNTTSRPRFSDYVASGHAMLTVLSIMWFFLVMPVLAGGPLDGDIFFLAVGLVASIGSVKITKLIAKSHLGLLWAVMVISWILFLALLAGEINKGIKSGFIGRDVAVLLGLYALLTIATFIVVGGLTLLWFLLRPRHRDQVIQKYETTSMA